MSKEDKSKSSPSPKPGLPFDPSQFLGMHSLAASGLPYSPLAAASFHHPYPFLAQPAAFPGLFGGLGALPNPLHAAALSHSLAAASLYGLPKYPNELGSPPPTSSSPSSSSSKRGKNSRSTPTPSSSPSPLSQQRPSSSTPLSMLSPSSHASLPSHFDPAAIAPYLSNWALNGSAYHLPLSSPIVSETPKRASTTSSSSSRQAKKSNANASSSSSKTPHAHQHDSSLPSSSLSLSSALYSHLNSSSSEHNKYSLEKSALGENFPFDPRALIAPYHLSPELAYLSQSLFMHRPDLDLSSSLLAAATSSSGLTPVAESGHKAGQFETSLSASRSRSPSSTSRKRDRVKGERSKGDKRTRATPDPADDRKSRLTNGTPNNSDTRSNQSKTTSSSRVADHAHLDDLHQSKLETIGNEDGMPFDLSNPSHCMDDSRRKHLADQIRKRVGLPESSMANLFTEHGLKHSDWLEHWTASQRNSAGKEKNKDEPSGSSTSTSRDLETESEADRMHLEANSLERQLLLQQDQLRELQRKYGMREQDESHSGATEENSFYSDRGRQGDSFKESQDESMDGEASSDSDGGESSSKRPGDSSDQGSPSKKRCYQTNETELIIPLEHGWNRQTIISGMGRRGIVGEVLYFAPCSKKMKTIPDVMRYLERNPNSDLGRENFSFNTKVNVGHFFEMRGGQSTPVPLTDTEVLERIEMSRGKRARMQMLARKKREKAAREHALARQIMENKVKRRMELQALEKQKEKEEHRLLKQQERFRLQEQLRKEREMRAQQIIEARNRRQHELEEMRMADAIKKNKEREMKRQQLVMLKEQERERRRQHLLLVKALEQRKKQEEKLTKERLREEKLNEKMKMREIRLHQRKVEMEVATEFKKPVEDMELKNKKKLPKFPRLKSRLAGKPIADCMMVVEFLNNFGLALNLEKSSLPTLETLEKGLMCDTEEDVEDLMSLVMHLLRFALDDVGVPNPKEAVTMLHQRITEMEMTDTTMSEILRIFIKARGEKEMATWLTEHPMESLNPTQKAAILGFLCNELLTSKVITSEIDKHMESINNLRRDKWVVEGQLRQLRVFQAKKFNKVHKSTDRRVNAVISSFSAVPQDEDTASSSKLGSDEEEEDKEDEEGSGNESDSGSSTVTCVSNLSNNMPFEPIDETLSREESDKRIDMLRKQHAAYRQKVFRSCLRLRAINIGQDRYKRTYWVLPLTGGIYVEGMESGEPEDYIEENMVKVKEELNEEEGLSEQATKDNGGEKDEEIIQTCEEVTDGEESKTDNLNESTENMDTSFGPLDGDVTDEMRDGDEKLDQSIEELDDEADVDEPEDMEVSEITAANNHREELESSKDQNGNGVQVCRVDLKDAVNGAEDSSSVVDTAKGNGEAEEVKTHQEVDSLKAKESKEIGVGGTLYNMLKGVGKSPQHDSSQISVPSMNGHLEEKGDCPIKESKPDAKEKSHENHSTSVLSPVVNHDSLTSSGLNGFSNELESRMEMPNANLATMINEAEENGGKNCTAASSDDEIKAADNSSHLEEKQSSIDITIPPSSKSTEHESSVMDMCTKPVSDSTGLVSINLSQKNIPMVKNGTEIIDLVLSAKKDIPLNLESLKTKTGQTFSIQNQPAVKETAADSQEMKSCMSDILKVPKVGHTPKDSLLTLLNHSRTKASTGEETATPSGVSASEVKVAAASSLRLPSTNSQSILSSSLLFSPFSMSSQSMQNVDEKSKSHSSTPITTSSTQSSLLVCPSPFSKSKSGLLSALNGKRANRADEGALNLMAAGSAPLPAHSKPFDHSSLPPHHPAAQFKQHRDQTPPAAHTKHTSKPIPSDLNDIGPSPIPLHLPHPPFIPGLPHHPYGGQASASQTLSSLASIVSPPPAHQHPPSTTASSFLMSTPKLPTFTTSLTSTAASSSSILSLSSSSSSSSSIPPAATSKTPPSFSLIDMVLKNEKQYSSSQLLHHAASQVLRSGDGINSASSITNPVSPKGSVTSIDLSATQCISSNMNSSSSDLTASLAATAPPPIPSSCLSSITLEMDELTKEGKSEEMWFSLTPRTPCDELSLTRPASQSATAMSTQLLPSALSSPSAMFSSNSSSPISSILNNLSLETLMPFLQSNPSLLSQESLRTSLQLLASPSPSPTSSLSAADMSFDFKVPQPPLESCLNYDPWDILRAAQGERQVIPMDKRHGWWRIYDLAMLKASMSATMNRGIREKNLQRAIHRYLDYAKIHATFDSSVGEKDPAASVECKADKKKKKPDVKKEKEEPQSNSEIPTKKEEETTETENTTSESADNTTDSTPAGAGDEEKIKQEVKDEDGKESISVNEDSKDAASISNASGVLEEDQEEDEEDFVAPDRDGVFSTPILHEIELAVLEEVEALEDRIFHASLQAKHGWRSSDDNQYKLVDHSVTDLEGEECYPLVAAKAKLIQLESNIERRYLKPPLARSVPLNISASSDKHDSESCDMDDVVAPGLALWRDAVEESKSAAQLCLCIQLLSKSISWEKSIMKVICQNCGKDDNEAELLLCDGCDKGFHTYCFKPKMDTIPEGDWYCFECVSKASGTPHCGLCGCKGGKIVSCIKCPRCVHLECMDPPLPRMPKRWHCVKCSSEKGNSKRSRKRKESLPTVQRIAIAKVIIKEEVPDESDALMGGMSTPPPQKSEKLATPAPSPKVEPSPKKSEPAAVSSQGTTAGDSSASATSDKKKRKRKEKETAECTPSSSNVSASPPAKKKEKKEKKDKKSSKTDIKTPAEGDEKDPEDKMAEKERARDQAACGKLLAEMEKHEEGWPFLKPVSQKQFPSYKKYIKTPMDFTTTKSKLKNKGYKKRQEFATDVRLIFDNCETFNEDDSEVGKAGHVMRSFFEQRWLALFPDDTT